MNCARYNLLSLNRHFKCNRALYSTQTAIKHQRIIHTNESDPRNHTEEHLGLYYRIPDEVFDRIFKLAGFLDAQNRFMSVVKDRSIMIRKPALDIISYLKRTDFSKPVNKYVICEYILKILFSVYFVFFSSLNLLFFHIFYSDGKNGLGKTYILNHVLHYAYLEQFVLIHLDWSKYNWLLLFELHFFNDFSSSSSLVYPD